MKSNYIKIIGLLTSILVVMFCCTFILVLDKSLFNNYIYIGFWLVFTILAIVLLGFNKARNIKKIDVIQIIIIYCISFMIFKYVSGIFLGFIRSPYSLEIFKIIQNTIPAIILIILEEVFRYTLVTRIGIKNKPLLLYTALVMSLFQIFTGMRGYSLVTGLEIFSFIGELVLPSIVTNILLTFIAVKVDYIPNIIYRVILELYIFFIPIIPDFGLYITSVVELVFPALLFLRVNTLFAKRMFNKARKVNYFRGFSYVAITGILIGVIALTSGLFKYYALAIGSNSMQPVFSRGDAVIVEKINEDYNKIGIGDILVHKHDNKIIIHRVIKIEFINNKYVYYTKGDNNDNEDGYSINEADIIGIVKQVIPFIGLPSVVLSEALN